MAVVDKDTYELHGFFGGIFDRNISKKFQIVSEVNIG